MKTWLLMPPPGMDLNLAAHGWDGVTILHNLGILIVRSEQRPEVPDGWLVSDGDAEVEIVD